MPAYRSAAEAEIRDAVVARLREARPGSRIIHEINVSTYGPNRIDLIAVGEAEIIAVEIKSAKDTLDRLEAQVASMKGVAHTVVAAIHEKFLTEHTTNRSAMHYERDGVAYRRNVPGGFPSAHETWVFPCVRRCATPTFRDDMETWRLKDSAPDRPLPAKALDMLWRDELFALCSRLSIPVHRQANMGELSRALRWNCTGRDLTHGVCSMLRERVCVEADQEIAA